MAELLNGNNIRLARVIPPDNRLAPLFIRNCLFQHIPKDTQHLFVIGIGSSKISGDSIGPFVGTLLSNLYPERLNVIGSLGSPIDASNLEDTLANISIPKNSFVIAVDSIIASKNLVDSLIIQTGGTQPGKALNNDFPAIGDCSILGVVTDKHTFDYSTLLYTDLNLIYTMANTIARGISLTVRQYFKYPSSQPILNY
jgi:putative sporulation protein YyaC